MLTLFYLYFVGDERFSTEWDCVAARLVLVSVGSMWFMAPGVALIMIKLYNFIKNLRVMHFDLKSFKS